MSDREGWVGTVQGERGGTMELQIARLIRPSDPCSRYQRHMGAKARPAAVSRSFRWRNQPPWLGDAYSPFTALIGAHTHWRASGLSSCAWSCPAVTEVITPARQKNLEGTMYRMGGGTRPPSRTLLRLLLLAAVGCGVRDAPRQPTHVLGRRLNHRRKRCDQFRPGLGERRLLGV